MSDLTIFKEIYQDPIGTIATPFRDRIAAETHVSHMKTDYRWAAGKPVNRIYIQGSQLPLQRNEAIRMMDGEWLLFIDDDMVFEAEAVGSLVASYHELKAQISEPIIVGGLCVRRYPPYQPTLFRARDMTEGPFNFIEDWQGMDYVEVDATGAAFYLIEPDVFSAIMGGPFPSLMIRAGLHPWPFYEWTGTMGEDLRFCLNARRAGVRIFVDTRIQIGHIGPKVLGISDFYGQVARRPEEVQVAVREMNDAVGLHTLSQEEARRREGLDGL